MKTEPTQEDLQGPIFEEDIPTISVIEQYANQMAEKHAREIDKNFWFIVKERPKWMPKFMYRAVIKNLVEFHQYK